MRCLKQPHNRHRCSPHTCRNSKYVASRESTTADYNLTVTVAAGQFLVSSSDAEQASPGIRCGSGGAPPKPNPNGQGAGLNPDGLGPDGLNPDGMNGFGQLSDSKLTSSRPNSVGEAPGGAPSPLRRTIGAAADAGAAVEVVPPSLWTTQPTAAGLTAREAEEGAGGANPNGPNPNGLNPKKRLGAGSLNLCAEPGPADQAFLQQPTATATAVGGGDGGGGGSVTGGINGASNDSPMGGVMFATISAVEHGASAFERAGTSSNLSLGDRALAGQASSR